jgi:MFS family permease
VAPAGLSLLVTSWPEEHARSHALGIYGGVVSTGFASGAVLGGLLVQQSWRPVFFVNASIGVLLMACYWLLPASPSARKGGLDLPGAVTGTAGVALIVLAVVRTGDTLSVTESLVLALAAALLLVGFVLRERCHPASGMGVRLAQYRSSVLSTVISRLRCARDQGVVRLLSGC